MRVRAAGKRAGDDPRRAAPAPVPRRREGRRAGRAGAAIPASPARCCSTSPRLRGARRSRTASWSPCRRAASTIPCSPPPTRAIAADEQARATPRAGSAACPKELKPLEERIAGGLVERGVLTRSGARCSGCSGRRGSRRPTRSPSASCASGSAPSSLSERQPTPEDAMLIAPAAPYDLLEQLVPKDRRKDAKRRAEAVAEGGTAAKAVGGRAAGDPGARSWPPSRSPRRPSRSPQATENVAPRRSWHTASRSVMSAVDPVGERRGRTWRKPSGLRDRQRAGADRRGRAAAAARALPARHARPDGHARRLRHVELRRLHRPSSTACRSRAARVLAVQADGAEVTHDRGHGRRRATCTRCRRGSGPSTACSAATARRA